MRKWMHEGVATPILSPQPTLKSRREEKGMEKRRIQLKLDEVISEYGHDLAVTVEQFELIKDVLNKTYKVLTEEDKTLYEPAKLVSLEEIDTAASLDKSLKEKPF